VDFSEARDLFVIIFQILGSDGKFLDCRLILEKLRGLNAKCPKLDFPRIVFLKETRGPPEPQSTVDRPWTAAPSSPEGEWGAGSAVGASPGHERRCGNQASRRRGGGRKNSLVRRSDAGEEKGGVW
jgi:hypothetical protein